MMPKQVKINQKLPGKYQLQTNTHTAKVKNTKPKYIDQRNMGSLIKKFEQQTTLNQNPV